MRTPKALFETPSVEAAVASLHPDIGRAASDELPDFVVGWSRREVLTRKPEFAVLLHERARYIRLPLFLDDFRREIDDAISLDRLDSPEARHLCTPGGRWRATIRSLGCCADDGGATATLRELERYAQEHWPGWYDDVAANLKDSIQKNQEIPAPVVEALCAKVGAEASRYALRALFSWTSGEQGAQQISLAWEAAACAPKDEWPDREDFANQAWWHDLVRDCDRARRGIDLIEAAPLATVVEQIRASALTLEELVRDWGDGSALERLTTLRQLRESLNQVVRWLPDVNPHDRQRS